MAAFTAPIYFNLGFDRLRMTAPVLGAHLISVRKSKKTWLGSFQSVDFHSSQSEQLLHRDGTDYRPLRVDAGIVCSDEKDGVRPCSGYAKPRKTRRRLDVLASRFHIPGLHN